MKLVRTKAYLPWLCGALGGPSPWSRMRMEDRGPHCCSCLSLCSEASVQRTDLALHKGSVRAG